MTSHHPVDPGADPAVGPRDPEHDPTASYALDRSTSRPSPAGSWPPPARPSRCARRSTTQPLAHIPQSTADDVARRFARARRAQARLGRRPTSTTAAGGAAAPARPRARPPGRDPRPDRLGVRQGPQARLRRAAARRADRPLLRPHRAPRTSTTDAPCRRGPGAHPGRGQPRAQGRRRHHLAVELPLHPGALRRPPGAARRQRRRRQARRPDDAVRAARRPAARGGRLPDGPLAGRRRPRRRDRRRDRSRRADYVCFTGSTATGTRSSPRPAPSG